MSIRILAAVVALGAAGLAGGCASDANLLGESLTTASVTPAKSEPKVDPQCVALMSKIDALRKEGTPERIEKVAAGKSKTAVVKRDALQRISDLDKANAEFQSRCSTLTPGTQAAAKPSAADTAKAQVEQAATDAAAKQATKTVAKAATKTVAKATPEAAATQAIKAAAQ